MANKITKKDRYTEMISLFEEMGRTDLVEFCQHEVELVTKKSGNRKPSAVSEQDERLKAITVEVLSDMEKGGTVSDISKGHEELRGLSNQKMAAILKKLIEDGKVVKEMDKKKAIFSLV